MRASDEAGEATPLPGETVAEKTVAEEAEVRALR